MNEDVRDPIVTERYRDIAGETTPEALNQAVLREARQQMSGQYSRNISWMRPMAWAASIGLCLAIVLELNNIPQQEPAMMQLPGAAPVAPSSSVPDAAAADRQNNFRATTNAPGELDEMADLIEPAAIAEPTLAEPTFTDRADPTPVNSERMEQPISKAVEEEGRTSINTTAARQKTEMADAIAAQSDDFAAVDAPAIEELESLNRMREGSNISEIPVGSAAADADASNTGMASEAKQAPLRSMAAGIAPAAELIADPACPAADREAPETWLDCINGLETDGMTELAAREREQLRAAFPEFEMP
ncbi:MAG: hypothetical protein KJO82_08370 [Gammaproteobacteria bacterium]|nr:hypothetical protein [Gammaproteobacteria bacterium]